MRLVQALGLSLLALAGCRDAQRPRHPNVILICLDTVRADHLGCYGYESRDTTPRLDALAREGWRFADTSSTAGWTKPSVPSFLTSSYPIQHGVYEGSAKDRAGEISHALPQAATTLAEVLQASGFATAAFVHNAQLRSGLGFEQGFELYRDGLGDAHDIRLQAQDWLEQRPAERPFLLYLHYLDAHWPWPVPDAYATRYASLERIDPQRDRHSDDMRDAINHGDRELSADEREAMIALYDGSLRYLDDQLAELFAWLEQRELWEDTIVCVVADHGEEFGEYGKVGHGHGLHESLLSVPWILRVPGRGSLTVATPVSLIDLAPTLVAAAGLAAPAEWVGIDRLANPDQSAAILAEHKEPRAYQQSLRRAASKLVRRIKPPKARSPADVQLLAGRYDVDVLRGEDGSLRARKVKSSDDDPADPLEIKGLVTHLSGAQFELVGIPVRLAPEAEFYGSVEAGSGREVLADGVLVKVVCERDGEAFLARRVKVYAADAPPDFELRGTLDAAAAVGQSGALVLGGLRVLFDEQTDLAAVDSASELGLTREELLEWVQTAGQAPAGFSVRRQLFDLGADSRELSPGEESSEGSELDQALDALGTRLASKRYWSAADTSRLDEAQSQALRALGY